MQDAEFTIPVVTRLQNNGDGSYTMFVYNNEDELIEDHHCSDDDEMTPEKREEILSENDPYENGYIGKKSIRIKVVDGVPMLDGPISFSAG